MATQLLFMPQTAFQSGEFSPGALAYFYVSGTTTPLTVYEDAAYAVPHPLPIVAGGDGSFPSVWFGDGDEVKVVITAADSSAIATIDPAPKVSTSTSGADTISKTPTADNPNTTVESAIDFLSEKSSFIPTDDERIDGAGFLCGFPEDESEAVEPILIVPLVAEDTAENLTAGDILYHDGANLVRLPKGNSGETLRMNSEATAPEWTRGGWTETAVVDLTNGGANDLNNYDFTSLPEWVIEIELVLRDVSTSGQTTQTIVTLSVDGVFQLTGYRSGSGAGGTGGSGGRTTGFLIAHDSAGTEASGVFSLRKVPGADDWIATHIAGSDEYSEWSVGGGSVALSGTLDGISLSLENSGTFDGSSKIWLRYR